MEAAAMEPRKRNAGKVQTSAEVGTLREKPLEIRVETITPSIATKLLASSTRNRHLKRNRIVLWADAMRSGRWKINGETVIIDWDGQLADGHHRCHACIECDTSFISVVVRGVDPACFPTVDTGVPRHAGDIATISGYENANLLAAAARILVAHDHGQFQSARSATPEDILAKIKNAPDLLEWLPRAMKIQKRFIPASLVCGMFCLFAKRHGNEYPASFLDSIIVGEGLHNGDPALTFRNRIYADRSANKLHGTNGLQTMAHLLASAWRFQVRGDNVAKLILPSELNQFPVIA